MGIKGISSAFDISRNTVRRYVRMYQDSGIPAEKLPSLSDARLQELFAIPGARERKPSERQVRLEALLPVQYMNFWDAAPGCTFDAVNTLLSNL